MLSLKNAPFFASFSVDDAKAAKQFYGKTLGLDVREVPGMEGQLVEILGSGNTKIMAYAKGKDHIPPTCTVLNIPVNDIGQAMTDLKAKGVKFEVYDGKSKESAGMKTDAKGLSRAEEHGMSMAWFKDPAGNFVSLIEG